MMTYFFLIFATLLAVGNAQLVEFVGGCPPVSPMANFDKGKFSGKWYEREKYTALYELTGKCVTDIFSDEFFFFYKTEHSKTDMITGIRSTDTVRMLWTNGTSTASLLAIIMVTTYPVPFPYNIISTDYTTYSVAYSCVDLGAARIRLMFIHTRSKTPDAATMTKAYDAITSLGLKTDNLVKTDHSNCPTNY